MIQGHLKIMVLKALSDEDLCGYEIIKKIEEKTGWKPSAGSIYPLLGFMLKQGIVKEERRVKKRVYSLTKKGKELLKEIVKIKYEIMKKIIKNIKVFETLCNKQELRCVQDMLKKTKEMINESNN